MAYKTSTVSRVIGLLAAASGSQALDGQLISTPFATTVVQTSVWLALSSLPPSTLFGLGYVRDRDLRILSLVMLAFGGVVAALVQPEWALLLAAIVKAAVTGLWLACPVKKE